MASSFRKRVRRVAGVSRLPIRLALEQLEDRVVPAQFTVGAGDVATLIADINTANGNGQSNIINLTAGTYDLTAIDNYWYGPNGLPAITSNLTINGNGATIQRDTTRPTVNEAVVPLTSTAPDFRLFYVSGGLLPGELPLGDLTLENLTLQNGVAQGGNSGGGGGGLGAGGAIFNQGTLSLNGVTVTNNQAIGGSGNNGTESLGGGGMGQDANGSTGGGFGGTFLPVYGGTGGSGSAWGGGGGGGGFVTGANGATPVSIPPGPGGTGGGLGGFGGGGADGGAGGNGDGSGNLSGGAGGAFGFGGTDDNGGGGGGGGVGGGGGAGGAGSGGAGGFGGGGGGSGNNGGVGGFGGGGGVGSTSGAGGFGGGNGGSSSSTSTAGGGGAGMGGGLFNMGASTVIGSGVVAITNSTFTANSAIGGSTAGNAVGGSGYGGAVFNLDGTVSLLNATLDANTVQAGTGGTSGTAEGGAVYNLADGNVITDEVPTPATATLTSNNSIFANSVGGHDVVNNAAAASDTAAVTGSTNLVMTNLLEVGPGTIPPYAGFITFTANPNLGSLQNNGGPTPTMADAPGSAAYGAGNATASGLPSTDQRGLSRLNSQGLDLGAFEFQTVTPFPPSPSPSPSPSPAPPPAPSGDVALLFLAEDKFAFTVDSAMSQLSRDPALTQLADHLMTRLNDLAGLNNPALGTGLAGLQTAIHANPYYGTSQGNYAEAIGLERAALFFATHDLN